MLDQMRLLAEALVAIGTIERTLIRVRPLVLGQRRFLLEATPTNLDPTIKYKKVHSPINSAADEWNSQRKC
jgi:hypothetical protein